MSKLLNFSNAENAISTKKRIVCIKKSVYL